MAIRNVKTAPEFPFLLGRAFIEAVHTYSGAAVRAAGFPFLLGRAFIEAGNNWGYLEPEVRHFPSFWEGLSLRRRGPAHHDLGS